MQQPTRLNKAALGGSQQQNSPAASSTVSPQSQQQQQQHCNHADHQGSQGYHHEADTGAVSYHGNKPYHRTGSSLSSVAAAAAAGRSNANPDATADGSGREQSPILVNGLLAPPTASSAMVNVSFAADPSLNMILSYNDYKALSLSMAQKPNVTSLSLQGNILSNATVVALCTELSSINCRLTSLNVAMCGLGNDNAVRIVSAVVANVHNRRPTAPNPQGPPTVIKPSDRRQPLVKNVDYLRSGSMGERGGAGAGDQTARRAADQQRSLLAVPKNTTPRSTSSTTAAASNKTARFSSQPRSASVNSTSSRVTSRTTLTNDPVGTYGYCGGIRVLDMSLNHITNSGAIGIAKAFNDASLAADLNNATPTTFITHQQQLQQQGYFDCHALGSGVSSATNHFVRSSSAASRSSCAASVSTPLSERRFGGLRSGSSASVRSHSRGGGGAVGGAASSSSHVAFFSNSHNGALVSPPGLHTLVLRFNRIGTSGLAHLLRATSDVRVLDVRYCAMKLGGEDGEGEEGGGEGLFNSTTVSSSDKKAALTPAEEDRLKEKEAKRKHAREAFETLLQGIADARTVQRLLLDGNGMTKGQLEEIGRLLSIATSGSLRAEGISAGELVGKLENLEKYVASKRPKDGSLYPPAVVEESAAVMGSTLYVRGELRDVEAKVFLYAADGTPVASTTVGEADKTYTALQEGGGGSNAAAEQRQREGRDLTARRRSSTASASAVGGGTASNRRASLLPPPPPPASIRPLSRSSSAANRTHSSGGGVVPTKKIMARKEGVEVSTSVAQRCLLSFNKPAPAAATSSTTAILVEDAAVVEVPAAPNMNNHQHLLTQTGGGEQSVSRRGLVMEHGWERPLCGPCPTVNKDRLAKALLADGVVPSSATSGFSFSARRSVAMSGGKAGSPPTPVPSSFVDGGSDSTSPQQRRNSSPVTVTAAAVGAGGATTMMTTSQSPTHVRTSRAIRAQRWQDQRAGSPSGGERDAEAFYTLLNVTRQREYGDGCVYADPHSQMAAMDAEKEGEEMLSTSDENGGSYTSNARHYDPPRQEFEVSHQYGW